MEIKQRDKEIEVANRRLEMELKNKEMDKEKEIEKEKNALQSQEKLKKEEQEFQLEMKKLELKHLEKMSDKESSNFEKNSNNLLKMELLKKNLDGNQLLQVLEKLSENQNKPQTNNINQMKLIIR